MNKKAVILGAGLLSVFAVLSSRRAGQGGQMISTSAPAGYSDSATPESPDAGSIWLPNLSDFTTRVQLWTNHNATEIETNTMTPPSIPQLSTNIAAMLAAIREAEGTARAGDPYRVCFGYRHTISSLADHPAVTGEWRGEPLSAKMCADAGYGPGCVSTAAGAYQIIKPTWLNLKRKLGLGDFSAASQDAAAVQLLRECGALSALEAGRFAEAVHAARKTWASLPGAGYGQGERSIAWMTDRFTAAGGVLA